MASVVLKLGRGNWCSRCGESLAGRAVARLSLGDEGAAAQYLCPVCAGETLRCATCGQPLDEAARHLFALAGEPGRLYCPACWARPHCHACGRPVGDLSYSRPDGRVLCARCHATAVYDLGLALQWYDRVQDTARRVLDLDLRVGAQLHLASRAQLTELRTLGPGARMLPPDEGHADYVGLFVYQWRVRSIYIEYGLPRIFFCEVLAHEYAHVWQAENAPLLPGLELREGFAEWVAYKVMESWGCRLRLERFRQRHDAYGAGLRRMLAWEAAGGAAGVVARIQRER